jgi:hypothetical protein
MLQNSMSTLSFKTLTTQVSEAPARIFLLQALTSDNLPYSSSLHPSIFPHPSKTRALIPLSHCLALKTIFTFSLLRALLFARPAVWIFAVPPQHYRTTENAEHTPKRQDPRPWIQTFQSSTFFSVTQCEGCESFVNTVVRENGFT